MLITNDFFSQILPSSNIVISTFLGDALFWLNSSLDCFAAIFHNVDYILFKPWKGISNTIMSNFKKQSFLFWPFAENTTRESYKVILKGNI